MSTPSVPGILVVDDDAGVRSYLAAYLPRCGFAAFAACGAEEALDLFQAHRESIFLALLDVDMPRIDGPTLLEMLRRLDPGLRCCFMTGGCTHPVERLGGAERVFAKPFPTGSLGPALRRLHAGPLTAGPER
ncbi:MAG: response regulator [Gemmataceae bacterium]|nr:response regulator [Gemmataceae bacterium]